MWYIFNLWLNIMNGRPVTFTMSGLPFRTPLALAHLKKDCFIRHIFLRWAWRHNSQGHSNIWGRGGDWIADAPPLKSTPTQPFYFLGKERGEKTLFFPTFFSKQWARKRENSHCRASGTLYLSVGWKALQQNERMRGLFTRAKLNEKGEGIKWKSSLLPTKLD